MEQALINQLCDLTKRWNEHEDVPPSQQSECKQIGRKLNESGGFKLMQNAYYEATAQNRAASVVAAYFDGIGDWRW